MPQTKLHEALTVNTPSFGECTLLPIGILPESFRTYEKLLATAIELGLTELKELSRPEVQEIFMALSFRISARGVETSESVSVLLSGSHLAYPRIDITNKNQQKEPCVTAIQFYFWDDAMLSTKGELIGGPIDMQLDEIPVNEFIPILGEDSTYCLFRGTTEEA